MTLSKTMAQGLRCAFGAAVAAGIATAPMAVQAAPAGDYTIGFVTENTGPIAAAGLSYYHGAQLAIDEINASGYAGQGAKLKLSEKESGSDAARSVQALSQFIADRNVIAVTCCILSPVAGAMKPVAINAKIPLVIYGATMPGIPQLPYVTSIVGLPGPQEVKMTQKLAQELKPKTVTYFVNADNEAFQGRFKAAQKVMEDAGIKTAGVVSILGSDTDFTAPATQAMGTNPDMIMVWTTQTPAGGIIAALRNRGYKGPIAANDVIAPPPMFKKIGEPLVGVPFPVLFSAEISDTPEAKKFIQDYQKRFNNDLPDAYAAQGYTAIYFIAQGLKSLSDKPTREALAEAIAKIANIEHNIYGGLPMKDGQADFQKSLIGAWSKEGKVVNWKPGMM
jgi:ABC-type branched-subunit amino acid transport system substrate-binding protein